MSVGTTCYLNTIKIPEVKSPQIGSPNSSIKVSSVSSLHGGTSSISDGISCKVASLRGASKLTTDKARAIMGLILLSAL